MKTDLIKFYFYKLILLLIVAICATLLAFFISSTLTSIESETAYNVILSGVPMLFFFAFMYSMQSRIKAPAAKEHVKLPYYLVFTLKETSVYLLFLLPFKIVYLINSEFALGDSIFAMLYAPHSLILRLSENIFINLIAMLFIYAVMTFIAHYLKVVRTYQQS